jgi:hypothetical protein
MRLRVHKREILFCFRDRIRNCGHTQPFAGALKEYQDLRPAKNAGASNEEI